MDIVTIGKCTVSISLNTERYSDGLGYIWEHDVHSIELLKVMG